MKIGAGGLTLALNVWGCDRRLFPQGADLPTGSDPGCDSCVLQGGPGRSWKSGTSEGVQCEGQINHKEKSSYHNYSRLPGQQNDIHIVYSPRGVVFFIVIAISGHSFSRLA